jgi:hypothetical protein
MLVNRKAAAAAGDPLAASPTDIRDDRDRD